MAVIGVKSITGITSITNAAGGADVLTFHSNNTTERVRITAAGRIGIGTDNPGSEIHIVANAPVLKVTPTNWQSGLRIDVLGLGNNPSNNQLFRVQKDGTTKLQLNEDGDLVITGDDNAELKLKCGTSTGNNIIAFLNSAGTTKGNIFYDSDNNFMVFKTNGTASSNERLRITSSGSIGIGTDSPGTRDTSGSVDIIQNHANTGPHFRVLNKHATLGGGIQFKCNNARGGVEFLNSSGSNNGAFYHSTGGWTFDQTLQLIGGSGLRIGTTSGSGYLINAKTSSADAIAKIESESGYDARLQLDTSNGGGAAAHVDFQMDGTTKGGIEYVNNASNADVNCMIFRTTANNERLKIKADGNIVATGNLKTNNITGKNLVINGSFQVDQRNDGAELSITSNNKFSADRWTHNNDGHTYYKTQRKNDGPIQTIGTEYYMRATVTTAVTLSGSTSQCIENNLEGNTVRWLNLGTSGAKQCTVSFWVRCSLTGTFGGALVNSGYNRCHPFSYTISSANTWEYKTYTFSTTGFTTGSFHTGTGVGLRLCFSYGNGPGRQADPANGWSNQVKFGPTGETNLVATNGATMDIASVQLEEGTQATRFDHRSYAQELALCQRYCVVYGSTDEVHLGIGVAYNSTNINLSVSTPVSFRAGGASVSKVTSGGYWLQSYVGASGQNSNATVEVGEMVNNNVRLYCQTTGHTSLSAGQGLWCQVLPNAKLILSNEL